MWQPQMSSPTRYFAGNRTRRLLKAAWARSLKVGKPCVDCGLECTEANYPAFDWDHRPGEVKEFTVANIHLHGRDDIVAEIAKCDLRCKNCHAIVTYQRRQAA
jgi:hypothetical protein